MATTNFNTTNTTEVKQPSTNLFSNDTEDATRATSVVETTVFASDANATEAKIIAPYSLDDAITSSSMVTNSQDLKSFLSRPFVVLSGVFSTIDTVQAGPDIQFPEMIRMIPMIGDKMKGFRGFRADIELRIVVNANKFQQGLYMLAFKPLGGGSRSSKAVNHMNDHSAFLTSRTQLPHVEIDLSCDTEATLTIPYSSGYNYTFCNTTSSEPVTSMGNASIYVYSPLKSPSGSTTANYKVYCSLKSVELIGAIIPQSGNLNGSKSSRKQRKDVSIQEAGSQGVGPISSPLMAISKAAGILSAVPTISSFMTPLSWATDILSNTAAAFGLAKPINMGAAQRVTRNMAPYFSNINTVDQSLPLSLDVKNAVQLVPGLTGTDLDEMAFANIAAIPAFVQRATWDDTMTSDIDHVTLAPTVGDVVLPLAGGGAAVGMTPLSFVARHFQMFRGSIVLTIKIVKTEFHSGRFSVSFVPGDALDPSGFLYDFPRSEYLHRHIIDIREHSTVTLEFPYLSSTNYIQTSGFYGAVYISVVDKLVAPASVHPSVELLFEMSAGKDMEFAYPSNYNGTPVTGILPQSGRLDECTILSSTIGSTTAHGATLAPAATCVGEKITSFRQLLKQMNFIPRYLPTSVAGTTCSVIPFAWTNYYYSTTPADQDAPEFTGDLYGRLSSVYLYSRGSVRWKALIKQDAAVQKRYPLVFTTHQRFDASYANAEMIEPDFGFQPTSYAAFKAAPTVLSNVTDDQCGEVIVPQYHYTFARLNYECSAHPQKAHAGVPGDIGYNALPKYNNSKTILQICQPQAPGDAKIVLYLARGGGDDVQFSGFISIPPMFEAYGTEAW